MNWNLADAKNRLSELLTLVHSQGPQRITRHNKDAVVVITASEYDKLRGTTPGFKDLLLSGPKLDHLDLARDKSSMRDISL